MTSAPAHPQGASFILGGGETGALIRATDWRDTPLGPASAWPQSLRTTLNICVSSRFPIAVYWGPAYVMLYNDDLIPMVGANKHPQALGRPAFEVLPEIRSIIEPMLDQVVRTGEPIWSEDLMLPLFRNDGATESYFTFTYSPIRDEAGQVGGVFCAVLETTDKLIEERRLRLLHALSEVTGAQTPREVCTLAATQLIRAGSDVPFALLYLHDGASSEFMLAGAANIEPGTRLAPRVMPVSEAAPWPFELAGTGPLRELALSDAPAGARGAVMLPIVRAGRGEPLGFIVAGLSPLLPSSASYSRFHNLLAASISQAVSNAAAYDAERQRAEALARVDRAKTTFFSNVSHEFRTPLTLMLAPIQDMVSAPARSPIDHDAVELLQRNALRLLKLVNTLLSFSRLESGRIDAVYEPVNLAALTVELASAFRPAIERGGLAFEVDCPSLSQPVYVDRDMWEKIVLNLLSNAFKYTLAGRIAVRLARDGAEARLEVRDTGVGIAAAELPRVFERFHRIEGTRARSQEGSGIGLSFVQELVRLHGGSVEVASELGIGTNFVVRLPLGAAHLPAAQIRDAAAAAPAERSGADAFVREALRWDRASDKPAALPSPANPSARERVLFADDNADMRQYVARLLGEHWEVETAHDGAEALSAIRQNPPALVLCDVMMPGLDGHGLVQALRSDAALRAIPIILLSARAGEEAVSEGLQTGADDYIVKPFSARDLLVRVGAKLAVARVMRESRELGEAQRRNLYRHFMQAPFPIAVFKGPGHIVELANPQTLAAWGKGEEVVGLPLAQGLPELLGQPFLGWLDQVFSTGVTHEGKEQLARLPSGPEGELDDHYFNFVYAPLRDPRGQVEGVLLSAFAVTEQVLSRLELERTLARAESLADELSVTTQRLHAAQRSARVGIFEWRMANDWVSWSPEIYALMGLPPGAVEASLAGWTEALVEEDREGAWDAYRHAVARGDSIMETELRLRQPTGGARWIRLSAEIKYQNGAPVSVLGAAIDIQMLKEAMAIREHALEEAERISRAKDEFLATMSHELRTPLNAMLGWAKLLQRQKHDPRKLDHGLLVIERNALAQARLISDLLDVSRIVSGKLRLNTERVMIAAAVGAAVDVVRPAADAKALELSVAIDPEVGAIVADPDRLQQIVWNLLSNAIKFTPTGGAVRVQAQRQESLVCIEVRDTGLGIAAEHLPLIFDRFQQVDGSTTRLHGGLGLGLAIVRHLTEAHGGTVSAHSEGLGHGARFRILLPVRAVFAAHDLAGGNLFIEAESSASSGEPRLRAARILIVDDDPDSLELLHVMLEEAGAALVTTAPSAASALSELERQRYDIVISDIGMPDMDGYELMRRLRARDEQLPSIALTAYARSEDGALALAAGFHHHLAKPVDARELLFTVELLLGADLGHDDPGRQSEAEPPQA